MKVCVESGPSICLSAVTNILAFTISAACSPPELALFGCVNAVAIIVDTIYSLTLYAALIAVCHRDEAAAITTTTEKEKRGADESNRAVEARNLLNRALDVYIEIVAKPLVGAIVLFALIVYWTIAAYVSAMHDESGDAHRAHFQGASQLTIDLSSQKFFLADSPVLVADTLKQLFVVPTFTAPLFIVAAPGNLSDARRVAQIDELVRRLESLPAAIGAVSTKYLLADYREYATALEDGDDDASGGGGSSGGGGGGGSVDAERLEEFLQWPEYTFYRGFVKFANDTQRWASLLSFVAHKSNVCSRGRRVRSFFFMTGYSGDLLADWSQRHLLLESWRRVVNDFPSLNATVYFEDAAAIDLLRFSVL